MFTKLRIFVLLTIMALMVICLPATALADVGDPTEAAPVRVEGFFERNFVITEIIAVPIFMFLMVIAMASDTTTKTIETEHWDFWKKPLGKSYTHVTVPKEPSSPEEIRNVLKAFCVIYPILRFTCLFGFFNGLFKFIGSFIDIFLR